MYPQASSSTGEKGMILFSTLALLSILLMVGIGSRVMLQNDYKVLINLRAASEAFYLSTAGLEWSKNEIFQATDFPPKPDDRSHSFAAGSFAVNFLSPAIVNPLNAKIVVRSSGTIGSAEHTIQAQLNKTYDLADGAISIRGQALQVNLSGGTPFFSGRDHAVATGKPLPGSSSRAALSVGDDSLRALIEQAVASLPQGSIDSGGTGPEVATSKYLPTTAMSQLAANLCAHSSAIVSQVPVTGALVYEMQSWGTRALPELRCIDGLSEPGDAVTLAGDLTGVGLLIIRNADLNLTGTFRWEGLVILTGADVSLKVIGAGNQDVIGAIFVNEVGSSPSKALLDVQGNLRVVFSRQALEHAAQLIPASILNNTYVDLPRLIKQDYWRSVTP